VLHNRENALITQAVHIFAREEQGFADQIVSNWTNLVTDVDDMPYE
jgi:sorting nexin-8